jgi:hypothetical protein
VPPAHGREGKGTLVNSRITAVVSTATVLVAGLALAGSASATYAPKLAVSIDPATPRSAVAITTTVTQAADETASKTVSVKFPDDWGTVKNQLTACTDADAQTAKCPDSSRMGSAEARNPLLGTLSGPVNLGQVKGGTFKIWVYLNNAVLHQIVQGVVEINAQGQFQSTFDGLPDVLTTFFQLKLDGPPRSLAQTGFGCGDRLFGADFTSQKGEKASATAAVTISGCPDRPPIVSGITLSKVLPAKGAKLAFGMDVPAEVVVTVVKKGVAKPLQSVNLAGRQGTNKLKGIGKGLKKGKYRLIIKATDSGGQVRTKKLSFRVR